jgi:hypothetical protein
MSDAIARIRFRLPGLVTYRTRGVSRNVIRRHTGALRLSPKHPTVQRVIQFTSRAHPGGTVRGGSSGNQTFVPNGSFTYRSSDISFKG